MRVEIRVRGPVSVEAADRLGLHASVAPSRTVLRGSLPDRPALHGVLERLRAGGLELIEVRRLPRTLMSLGASLFLVGLGAILRFAVTADFAGIDIQVVGTILMVVGVLGFLISLFFFLQARRDQPPPV